MPDTLQHLIVQDARSMLGTPFHHQGRLPGVGIDCVGVLVVIARQRGLVPPSFDVTGYSEAPDGTLLDVLDRYLAPIPYEQAGFGDVVAFVVDKAPQHVGVIVPYAHGGPALVHACIHSGRVVEHRLLYGPRLRFVRAYRFPEGPWLH
jgi:cell wall-associated NlpC family hydrolase